MSECEPGPRPLYAVTIHGVAAGGDLGKMKELLAEAEAWLTKNGNVSAAVEVLKSEIAKLEARR